MSYNSSILVELGDSRINYGFMDCSCPSDWFLINNTSDVYTDNSTESILYDYKVTEFWDRIFRKKFVINIKGKSVSIIRPTFVSDRFINTTLQVLFTNYEVQEVHFQPRCILPLLPLGCLSGIVVECNQSSTQILPIVFGKCDIFHSMLLKYGISQIYSEDRWLNSDVNNLSIVDVIIKIILESPIDCRKELLSRIIVYNCEKDISDMEIQTKVVNEIQNRKQSSNLPSSIASCAIDKLTSNLTYYNLYWKGFCVANRCHIKDEHITNKQWEKGIKWEDPFVTLQ